MVKKEGMKKKERIERRISGKTCNKRGGTTLRSGIGGVKFASKCGGGGDKCQLTRSCNAEVGNLKGPGVEKAGGGVAEKKKPRKTSGKHPKVAC